MNTTPMRRREDHKTLKRLAYWWSERGYRDIWLILISLLVLFALKQNNDRIADIQHDRASNIRNICTDQNHRHDKTVAQLDNLFANANAKVIHRKQKLENIIEHMLRSGDVATPHKDAELVISALLPKVSIKPTKVLIDRLAPKQNCKLLVKQSVSRK